MSALQELQLLEIMCSCFQEQSRDAVRQLMFSALFSLQGNQADESRMALLGKLVSMAIAVGRVPIMECAATWLQVRIVTLRLTSSVYPSPVWFLFVRYISAVWSHLFICGDVFLCTPDVLK